MKEGQLKGRLIAFLPVAGLLTGLIAGALLEWLQVRFDPVLTGHWIFWIVTGGTGLACGVVSAVLSWLLLDRYLRELRAPLTELSSLPFGPSTQQHNDPTRSPADGLHAVVRKLSDVKQRLDRITDRAGDLARGDGGDAQEGGLVNQIEQRRDELTERRERLREIQQRFDERIRPVFDLEFAPVKLPGVVEFDRMVRFQEDLDQELNRQLEGWEGLFETLNRLEETPASLREAIASANELILKMSELFERFPHEELPRRAEQLRQRTRSWEGLAEEVETGLESFKEHVRRRRDQLGEMKQRIENTRAPKDTWNEVKEELSSVDTIVRQIRQATDGEWVETTAGELRAFREHADGLIELLEGLDQRLRRQQRRLRDCETLLRDVEALGRRRTDDESWTSV